MGMGFMMDESPFSFFMCAFSLFLLFPQQLSSLSLSLSISLFFSDCWAGRKGLKRAGSWESFSFFFSLFHFLFSSLTRARTLLCVCKQARNEG